MPAARAITSVPEFRVASSIPSLVQDFVVLVVSAYLD